MGSRNFRELAARAKETWSEEAAVVYDAATDSYEAEFAACHGYMGARRRSRLPANEKDSQCPPTRS